MIACFLAPQFGISCECRRHPELNNKPLALLNESEILCAVSPEATSFGVHPGQKRSGAAALCEELDIRPYDHPFYYEEAQVLWDMMAIESSVVEPISPEAAFVFIREQAALGICENLVEQLSRVGDCGVQAGLARTRSVARNP